MDKDLEPSEPTAGPAVAAPAAFAEEAAVEAEGDAPVVLSDAMCGAFCSIRSETRLA